MSSTVAVDPVASNPYLQSLSKTGETKTSSMAESESRFLKLLTTQLQNQDPLNPMDNAQMTSQMAQINTVSGIERLNTTLNSMLSNSADAQWMQAAGMVGRNVLVEGDDMQLTAEGGVAGFQLEGPADEVVATITDANGLVVKTIRLGDAEAGVQDFSWDGLTTEGEAAAPGSYSISLKATLDGEDTPITALQMVPVSGVVRENGSTRLELGTLGRLDLDAVKQIY